MSLCYCYWGYRNCKVNAIIFIKILFRFSLTFLSFAFFFLFCFAGFTSHATFLSCLVWMYVYPILQLLTPCFVILFTLVTFFSFWLVPFWNNFLGMVHVNCKICIKHDSVNSRTYSTVKWQTNRMSLEYIFRGKKQQKDRSGTVTDAVLCLRCGNKLFSLWSEKIITEKRTKKMDKWCEQKKKETTTTKLGSMSMVICVCDGWGYFFLLSFALSA